MNILSLVAHGQKEIPELGVLSRNIETPEGVHDTAVLGTSMFDISRVYHISIDLSLSQAWDDSGMLRWPLVVFQVSYSPLWATLGEPQKAPLTISIPLLFSSRQCMVIPGWGTTLNVFKSPTTLKRPNIKIYLMSSGEATTPL